MKTNPTQNRWLTDFVELHGFLTEHQRSLLLLALDETNKTILRQAYEGSSGATIGRLAGTREQNIYARVAQMRKVIKAIRKGRGAYLSEAGRLCIQRPQSNKKVLGKIKEQKKIVADAGLSTDETQKSAPLTTPEAFANIDLDAIADALTDRIMKRITQNLMKRIL